VNKHVHNYAELQVYNDIPSLFIYLTSAQVRIKQINRTAHP